MAEKQAEETVRIEGIEMPIHAPVEEAEPLEPHVRTEPQDENEPIQTESAFIVLKLPDGRWVANSEILGKPIMVGREATTLDMRQAAHDISDDIATQEAAERTVFLTQQLAAQMVQKQRDAQVYAEVAQGLSPKGAVDLSKIKK